MGELNLDGVLAAVRNYLNFSNIKTPFFVAFNAKQDLVQLRDSLYSSAVIRLSDFCGTADSLPDEDRLIEYIQHSPQKSILLLGVGEYAVLSDNAGLVHRLFDLILDQAKIVVPLWNGHGILNEICGKDPRIRERKCVAFTHNDVHWTVKLFLRGLIDHPHTDGFKALLQKLEMGCNDEVNAFSALPLNPKWCKKINSAYEIYKLKHPDSPISKNFFSEEYWKRFCDDDRQRDNSIESPDRCLEILEGIQSDSPYLQLVISQTENYSNWKYNLLSALLSVSPKSYSFQELYLERKKIVSDFDRVSIEEYVMNTRKFSDPETQIHYLTTSTYIEINEMMSALSKCETFPEAIRWIYPELWNYMCEFKFLYGDFSEFLTHYFSDYKRQKIKNQIEPLFYDEVKELAESRPQFALPTRESVLEKLDDSNTCLFWVDALGCEWLAYIQFATERKRMKLKVTPTRAILPTITSVNRGFYDEWKGPKEKPIKELDKIKHGDFKNDYANRKEIPSHLSEEIEVIDHLIDDIGIWLKQHNGGKAVLTSDHGATRLAVILEKFTVWEMPEKGKHGGRCCKVSDFDGSLPSCSTKSDDEQWHVLAGYDQFRGGRSGDVEVHGGATLEEMIVPVVELEMLDSQIRVELVQKNYKVTFRDSEINLELFCISKLSNPSACFQGKLYPIVPHTEKNGHYWVKIPKVVTGEYVAEIYDGDTRIAQLDFSVVSGGATINNLNDFF